MASNINVVVVSGNLGKDAEVRETADGRKVVTATIAVKDYGKDEEHTNWFDLTFFGERFAKIAPYLEKGKKITVRGRLHQSTWDKDGQKRSKVSIYADDVELPAKAKSDEAKTDESDVYYDIEIPF